jgi:hypothetical protein
VHLVDQGISRGIMSEKITRSYISSSQGHNRHRNNSGAPKCIELRITSSNFLKKKYHVVPSIRFRKKGKKGEKLRERMEWKVNNHSQKGRNSGE